MSRKHSVLVIDDEASIRELLAEALNDKYHVLTAANGVEGLAHIQKHDISMVICDLEMPKMNGFVFLDKIREQKPTIPVVVLSGHDMSEPALKAIEKGAVNFIDKPLDIVFLESIVQKSIERKQLLDYKRELFEHLKEIQYFDIPNDESYFPAVIEKIISLIADMKLDAYTIGSLRSAVLEALRNAYIWGNKKNRSKRIYINTEFEKGKLCIKIRDEGGGFNPNPLLEQLRKNPKKVDSRGLLIMMLNADDIIYNETGNEVCIIKILGAIFE